MFYTYIIILMIQQQNLFLGLYLAKFLDKSFFLYRIAKYFVSEALLRIERS